MDLLAALDAATDRFTDVLGEADPATPVPTCDGWTVLDLAGHLATVQCFWGSVVRAGGTSPPDEDPPPTDLGACLDLLARAQARLVRSLREADEDAPVWSWHDDASISWVRRRMAHEALVHRLDAEAATGARTPVDDELAADGIDELLTTYVLGVPEWASFTPSGERIRVATSAPAQRSWTLELGRVAGVVPGSDRAVDLPGAVASAEPADLVIDGPAPAVHAALWGRGPSHELVLTGDAGLADELRLVIADATQ